MPLSLYKGANRAFRLFPSHALRRLVLAHRDACMDHGLDAAAVENANDTVVLRWLEERGGLLPADLADDLERIDELTNERGASTLVAVVREAGVELRSLGLDPVEVAVSAFLDQRALFEKAHGRRAVETLRSSTEFRGRRPTPAKPVDLSVLQALEVRLGVHFDARGRSAHCRIAMGRDGERMVFSVAHGALVRADEALDDAVSASSSEAASPVYLAERNVRYRPQRHDVVIFDGRDGSLRVRASDAPTLHAYRRGFGELLHGDAEWFGNGPVVSLQPLVDRGATVEMAAPGLREVRVVGLSVRFEVGQTGTVTLESEELWPFLQERMNSPLAEGELLKATFRVWRVGNPRSATAWIASPSRVEYGCVGEKFFRPWLEARGFLARGPTRMAV